MPQTLIITGAYGSGKTECALALALEAVEREPVALVDLDFVTPYFRAQDHQRLLAAHGVEVIAPEERVAAIDAPALPPAAGPAISHPTGLTIVDLGGDPAGATVFGQFAPSLTMYACWAVVNFARPTTATPALATALLADVATAARIHLTGLISNTHLGAATTAEEVLDGLAQARVLAARLHLPIVRLGVPAWVTLPPQEIPLLPITPRLKRPWE